MDIPKIPDLSSLDALSGAGKQVRSGVEAVGSTAATHLDTFTRFGQETLTNGTKAIGSIGRQPLAKLGAGAIFKIAIPVAASIFPLLDIPVISLLPKILIGRYSGRVGQKALNSVNPKELPGVYKQFHHMANSDLTTVFSDEAHFRQFVLRFNYVMKEATLRLPFVNGVQGTLKRLPLKPGYWGWMKRIPLIGKNLGTAAHKQLETLHEVRQLPEANFRRELYRNFVRINPKGTVGKGLQFALDANTPDLQLMGQAMKAPTLVHALWDCTAGNIGRSAKDLVTNGPIRAFHRIANRYSILKPFSMLLKALRLLPKNQPA